VQIKTGMSAGKTYYFKMLAVDANGGIGAFSNEVCKLFPAGVPGTFVITIT
jgi:hypothetical protein